MKVLKTFGESSDHFGFLAGMKVLKTFRESSDHFELFGWYENSKDF